MSPALLLLVLTAVLAVNLIASKPPLLISLVQAVIMALVLWEVARQLRLE